MKINDSEKSELAQTPFSSNKLNAVLEQAIPGLGYELVDIEIAPSKLIRVYIDKDGGVNIDDCELVSNHISKLLLVEEINYNRLEVSSPGIERPLKKIEDYIRFNGRLAKIKVREAIDGQKVFQGLISEVAEDIISLTLDNLSVMKFEFGSISKARLIFDYKTKK